MPTTPITPSGSRATRSRSAPPPTWDQLANQPVIVGAGLAGMMTALELAPRPCVLITAGSLPGECASSWAQGGLAAAVGLDDDPSLHAADTLAAGAGLCDPAVVARVTAAAPAAVQRLLHLGARLDTSQDGRLRLGLEAAHSRHRIVHADGDATGAELVRAAAAAVRRTRPITVLEHTFVRSICTEDDDRAQVLGLLLLDRSGERLLPTGQVILATGGIGGLFAHTTNPTGSWGGGLALGLRAGARARDLELVQFHPTALDVGLDPMPLVSEAVRGEGARLVDTGGTAIIDNSLAPRDVVARAVWASLEAGRGVYLDTPTALGSRFATRFPSITASCRAVGLDPSVDPLPVRPAAHYHMGGLLVDGQGRTSVPGLWAVGEVASTGLHGANRLASNSLLEAVVTARWVAASVLRSSPAQRRSEWTSAIPASTRLQRIAPASSAMASDRLSGPDPVVPAAVRELLSSAAGVLREQSSLMRAVDILKEAARTSDPALVALMICWSALNRTESRGAHTRTDYPGEQTAAHSVVSLDSVLADLDGRIRNDRSA